MAVTSKQERDAAPPGYQLISVRTTYLEMLRNRVPDAPATPEGWTVRRWVNAPLDEYRGLFAQVGGDWGWTGRLLLGDQELRELLDDKWIEVYRLKRGSEVAGFIELDRRTSGQVEIVYFGLKGEYMRQGLGGFLLRWAIHKAWQPVQIPGWEAETAERLWLHTCDQDHPRALAMYQKAGFQIYHEETGLELYPSSFEQAKD